MCASVFTEEESAVEMAKRLENELAGSILALWQQRLTQSSSFDEDIEIEYASESERDSTDPPSPAGDDPSVVALSKQTSPSHSLVDRNGNRYLSLCFIQVFLVSYFFF